MRLANTVSDLDVAAGFWDNALAWPQQRGTAKIVIVQDEWGCIGRRRSSRPQQQHTGQLAIFQPDTRLRRTVMLIGYARVSTVDQTLTLQQHALTTAGCERIFTDTASGLRTGRPGPDEALDFARPGDTLVVWRLDRLGCLLRHLIDTVALLQERGIGFKSLQEQLDTTTSGGRLVFHVFGALAECERDLIQERTHAGLTAAWARGRLGGRPCPLDPRKVQITRALCRDKSNSIADICRTLRISRATLYRYLETGTEKSA